MKTPTTETFTYVLPANWFNALHRSPTSASIGREVKAWREEVGIHDEPVHYSLTYRGCIDDTAGCKRTTVREFDFVRK